MISLFFVRFVVGMFFIYLVLFKKCIVLSLPQTRNVDDLQDVNQQRTAKKQQDVVKG